MSIVSNISRIIAFSGVAAFTSYCFSIFFLGITLVIDHFASADIARFSLMLLIALQLGYVIGVHFLNMRTFSGIASGWNTDSEGVVYRDREVEFFQKRGSVIGVLFVNTMFCGIALAEFDLITRADQEIDALDFDGLIFGLLFGIETSLQVITFDAMQVFELSLFSSLEKSIEFKMFEFIYRTLFSITFAVYVYDAVRYR